LPQIGRSDKWPAKSKTKHDVHGLSKQQGGSKTRATADTSRRSSKQETYMTSRGVSSQIDLTMSSPLLHQGKLQDDVDVVTPSSTLVDESESNSPPTNVLMVQPIRESSGSWSKSRRKLPVAFLGRVDVVDCGGGEVQGGPTSGETPLTLYTVETVNLQLTGNHGSAVVEGNAVLQGTVAEPAEVLLEARRGPVHGL
jgi:hypothetical protein